MTGKPPPAQTASAAKASTAKDWEAFFEDQDTGLIPLLAKARSASMVKQISFVIVERLYIRKNDAKEIEKMKSELSRIIPGDLPQEALPRIIEGVSEILRRIKNERKKKAAEHEASKKLAELKEKHKPLSRHKPKIKDRRKPKSSLAIRILAFVLVLSLVSGLAYFYIIYAGGEDALSKSPPNLALLQQIKDAARGADIKTHVFGGEIQTGTRGDKLYIVAVGVPPEACQSISRPLASLGVLAINGVTPRNIAPDVISGLCFQEGGNATITWFPRQ